MLVVRVINNRNIHSMIVKIESSDIEVTKEVCVQMNCTVSFYTIETNSIMVQAEILDESGCDVSPADAWYVGRSIAWKIATDKMKTL